MRILILTFSCAAHRLIGGHDAIRSTWKKAYTAEEIDHRFVLGSFPAILELDEIQFAVPDNYGGVPQKHRAAIEWAKRERYDYVFCSDIDTYIAPTRLLASGFMEHDFVGGRCENSSHPSGGGGYWLSRRAFDPLIASSGVGHSWSDLWAFTVLHQAGIALHHDNRYLSRGGDPIPIREEWDRGVVSVHLGRSDTKWNPDLMRKCHQSFLEAS